MRWLAEQWSQQYNQEGWAIKYYPWTDEFSWVQRSVADIRSHRRSTKSNAPIILIGHSYGGDTAYQIAKMLPEKYKPTLITLDAVGSRAAWGLGIPWVFDFRLQDSRLPSPTQGVWINVRAKKSQYNVQLSISFGPQYVLEMRKRLGDCDFVAHTGGPYGFQKNADTNLVVNSKFDHCDADKMLELVEGRVVKFARCQSYGIESGIDLLNQPFPNSSKRFQLESNYLLDCTRSGKSWEWCYNNVMIP